ncbi:hypothetical protein SD71_02150 [Cohnella kolymensis]|uniref:DUF1468 domain-containing protein n=1 Tax=Cohnella kolymensis TaxID=1590652 RepID=A0ABR5AA28_9BACL|nr:tripartite tricarboxylate transporter TctB family protein [Cohnella kolymensis]KIL37465.1 hypothetical protein SD71_02150 [Cohnella kolymensis]
MTESIKLADRVGAILTFLLGVAALVEAARLFPDRSALFVGDHTFAGLIGIALLVLGGLLLFQPVPAIRVDFPTGKVLMNIGFVILIMFLYWLLIPILGYVLSTLLALAGLFKVMGSYSLIRSSLYGALTIAALYLLFIYWLRTPFPDGIFGF